MLPPPVNVMLTCRFVRLNITHGLCAWGKVHIQSVLGYGVRTTRSRILDRVGLVDPPRDNVVPATGALREPTGRQGMGRPLKVAVIADSQSAALDLVGELDQCGFTATPVFAESESELERSGADCDASSPGTPPKRSP